MMLCEPRMQEQCPRAGLKFVAFMSSLFSLVQQVEIIRTFSIDKAFIEEPLRSATEAVERAFSLKHWTKRD